MKGKMMTFQINLLNWYDKNKRSLPWRETSNPYHIWLSEIMLQQTQVATVIDYYLEFTSKYDSFESLSKATEEDILKLWEGLGYYSRARRLIPCAKMIVNEFNGHFPQTYKEALTLPGVGPYTAGAILSIAFNKKIAAVDGNVKRVYARLKGLTMDISAYKSKEKMKIIVEKTLPENCRDFNQSLMELGALICTPKNPKCHHCPIWEDCIAFKENTQNKLPIKSKKIKKKNKEIYVFMIKHETQILLIKRPSEGLLASLWGFPIQDKKESSDERKYFEDCLKETYGLTLKNYQFIKKKKHIFTHLIWHMHLYELTVETPEVIDQGLWLLEKELKNYPMPTAFKKLLT